jgi:hypothetical protein
MGALGAFDPSDFGEGRFKDVAVEEEAGVEGDVLGGGSDVFVGGEVGEKVADFVGSEVFGMAFVAVIGEVLPNDSEVGLFGSIGEIPASHGTAAFFEEGVEGHKVRSVQESRFG